MRQEEPTLNQTGTHNEQHGAEAIGLSGTGRVFWNLGPAALYERVVARGEARLSDSGALVVATAPHTGLSLDDRYIVRDEAEADDAGQESPGTLSRGQFEALKADLLAHAGGRTLFAQDLHAGTGAADRIGVRVLAEHAWHALFMRNMLRAPDAPELADFVPALTVLCVPGFKADPEKHGVRTPTAIACDLANGLVLIAGTLHAGEIKEAVFGHLAHVLPARGVLPVNGAANVGPEGDVALFLGASGAGKTTLADDPARARRGDGAQGWSTDGLIAFEEGCYAGTLGLAPDATPAIHAAARRFGTVLENVFIDPDTRVPDFGDASLTDNPRAAYSPDDVADGRVEANSGAPKNIFLLAVDGFGVLPPLARLTPAQALYHFLSGYSAPPGDGERPARFSAGFAAAPLSRAPSVHGDLLRDLIAGNETRCWLVNTGWIGGRAGAGQRVPLATTRRLVAAVLGGELEAAKFRTDQYFGFAVPVAVDGVDSRLLDPARAWPTRIDHAMAARRLVGLFTANFARFETAVDDEVRRAQPGMAIAAE